MAKKKRTVFAVDSEGNLFVELRAVIPMTLIAVIDGVPLTFFGKSRKAYLAIDVAIEWLEREIARNPDYPGGKAKGPRMLEALRHGKAEFMAGRAQAQ